MCTLQINKKEQPVDYSQLNQSRLGLISQASMLLITVLFILSDILGQFWKSKWVFIIIISYFVFFIGKVHWKMINTGYFLRVPVEGRKYHEIMFRAVEVGTALWFPCCLWNVNRPDQLWILNPKKILKTPTKVTPDTQEEKYSLSDNVGCYFCYDPERKDAGPLIQPCECRGDVATVHHECLRRWLLQVK